MDPHSSNNDKWNSLLKVNRYWLAIQQGDAALKANNPDRAERLFQQARNVDNTDSYAVLGLGDVAMARKDYPAAERYYQQTLRMDSGNTNAVRGLANIYRQQSPEKAEAFIASLSASQRRSIDDIERSLQNDRLAQQAEALENQGKWAQAAALQRQRLARHRQRMDYLPTFAGSLAGRTTQPGRYVNAQSGAAEAERPGAGLRLRAVPLWS
ncbi:tetratricopeptide repeat protein [Escherichia coli]